MQLALDLFDMPLNRGEWDDVPNLVEGLHEEMLIRNLRLLRDSNPGSEQHQEVMDWLDAPIVDDGRPLTFAMCCKVIGVEDPIAMREKIISYLDIIE